MNLELKDYYEIQAAFFRRHPTAKEERTSTLSSNWEKHWVAEDGAEMWEMNHIVIADVKGEANGLNVTAKAILWKRECWNTDAKGFADLVTQL